MESGSGLDELSFWYTGYLPWNQQVTFLRLLNVIEPCRSSSYKFDYSAGSVSTLSVASTLKTGTLPQSTGKPTT
jgi:hypothetical protein